MSPEARRQSCVELVLAKTGRALLGANDLRSLGLNGRILAVDRRNMAGKSGPSAADRVDALLAQMGSFVSATRAR